MTDRFRQAVLETHRVSIAATVHPVGGLAPAQADTIGGSLRLDRDARVRRSGSIIVGFDLKANLDYVRDLPFGSYAEVERGILYADGAIERPTIGYLRVGTVSWSELEGQASLELADRMAQVQDEAFPFPWTPNGLKPSDAVVQAVQDVFGDSITYNVSTDPASEPTLKDVTYDQDRGQAISDLAASVGAAAYFNSAGDFVLAPNPADPATLEPDWTLEIGDEGTLEEVQENLDRSAVRNGVAVRGQPSADAPPIYSLAVDDNPDSPTRWGGPFGKVALIVTSQAVSSQAQADSTAASLLNLRLGVARAITFRGVPMPALEPDDVILATYADGREELLRVNALQMPLDVASSMEVVATGHYRPEELGRFGRRRRPSIRVYGGARAWRRLEGARVIAA